MKVLLIAHSCIAHGEGQRRAQELGKIEGIQLHVVMPDRWYEYGQWRTCEPPVAPSFTFDIAKIRWPWSGPGQWYLHYYPALKAILGHHNPDVIDLWEEAWGLVSFQVCRLKKELGLKSTLLCETEANINRSHPIPFRWFRQYTLRHADVFVARQSEGVGVLRELGFRGPVRVVGNAVDEEAFRSLNPNDSKMMLGLSGFVVGYIGRFVESKGLREVMKAMELLDGDVSCVFVGSGLLREELEVWASRSDLAGRVKILAPRRIDEMPAVMNAFDVLLLMSRTEKTWKEQFGRVIIEAHACGVPVIGSSSGAIPEVVGEGGTIVREGDVSALVSAVRKYRDDPELRVEHGRRGRRQVEEKFTWRKVAEEMAEIYKEMILN